MDDQSTPSHDFAMPARIAGSETITVVEGVPPITLNWVLSDSVLRTEVVLENELAQSSSVVELPFDDLEDYEKAELQDDSYAAPPSGLQDFGKTNEDGLSKPERIEGTESVTVVDGLPPVTLNWVITKSTLKTEIIIENGTSRSSSVIELPIKSTAPALADSVNSEATLDVLRQTEEAMPAPSKEPEQCNDSVDVAEEIKAAKGIEESGSPQDDKSPDDSQAGKTKEQEDATEALASDVASQSTESQIEDPALYVLPIQPISMQQEFESPFDDQASPANQNSSMHASDLSAIQQTAPIQNAPEYASHGTTQTVEPVMPAIPQASVIDEAARDISIPAEKPDKKGRPKKKHRVRNTIIAIIVVFLLYELAGVVIAPLVLPYSDVGTETLPENFGQTAGTSERILYLGNDNDEALRWRLKVISEAKSELCFESLDFRNDESSHDLMAAMYDAAERGVHVRIIIDGITAVLKLPLDPVFAELYNHPNVEVKFYNAPNLLTPWTLNYRLHEKVITVDNTFAVIGGRNSMNYFLGSYGTTKKADRDILVYNTDPNNDLFTTISRHFNAYWDYDACTDANPLAAPSTTLASRWNDLVSTDSTITTTTNWNDVTFAVDDIAFITGGIEATNKCPTLWKSICSVCSTGKDVIIQTPYVMFSTEMYTDLTTLSMNRNVSVVTNDITDHTNAFGTMDLTHERDDILSTGVTLVETQWPAFVHAKAFVVDNDISLIGSFNCDSRSAYLDNECMLVIKSAALNEQLRAEISQCKDLGYVQTSTSTTAGSQYDMEKRENNSIIWTIGGIITKPFRYLF